MNKYKALVLLVCTLSLQTDQLSAQDNATTTPQSEAGVNNFGLAEESRQQVAALLNTLLADEYVLYTKNLNFHWNIKGKHFGALHKLFQEQYEKLFEIIDDVAERVLKLGFNAAGTLHEFINMSHLSENPGTNFEEKAMISSLLEGHEAIIKELHQKIDASAQVGDHGTNNLLADILEKHEKMAWMLRAHLE